MKDKEELFFISLVFLVFFSCNFTEETVWSMPKKKGSITWRLSKGWVHTRINRTHKCWILPAFTDYNTSHYSANPFHFIPPSQCDKTRLVSVTSIHLVTNLQLQELAKTILHPITWIWGLKNLLLLFYHHTNPLTRLLPMYFREALEKCSSSSTLYEQSSWRMRLPINNW